MFQIKTKNTKSLKPSNWLRIGDLSNFEGPILSLFQDLESNYLFLYDWVDRDQTHNRWMIYTVYADKLNQFLNKEISHFDLFQQRPTEAVYVSDMDNRGMNFSQYPILELVEVPEDYVPSKENYFDEGDCVGEERIRLVVSKTTENNQKLVWLKSELPNIDQNLTKSVIRSYSGQSGYRRKYGAKIISGNNISDTNILSVSEGSYRLVSSGKSKSIKEKVYVNQVD